MQIEQEIDFGFRQSAEFAHLGAGLTVLDQLDGLCVGAAIGIPKAHFKAGFLIQLGQTVDRASHAGEILSMTDGLAGQHLGGTLDRQQGLGVLLERFFDTLQAATQAAQGQDGHQRDDEGAERQKIGGGDQDARMAGARLDPWRLRCCGPDPIPHRTAVFRD